MKISFHDFQAGEYQICELKRENFVNTTFVSNDEFCSSNFYFRRFQPKVVSFCQIFIEYPVELDILFFHISGTL